MKVDYEELKDILMAHGPWMDDNEDMRCYGCDWRESLSRPSWAEHLLSLLKPYEEEAHTGRPGWNP
jgi:hypothetical protein